jgi:uncharacterized OsmC-like protein
MTQKTVNGLDVQQLFETIDTIKHDPCIAAFTFRARNRWESGGINRTTLKDYYAAREEMEHETTFELVNDEPPILLGQDTAPNPVEYVLHALAGCITTSLVAHAAARGINVEEVETRFVGNLDVRGFLGMEESVRNGYQQIAVDLRVKAETDDATIHELCEIAKNRSPVFDIVSHGVPVAVTVRAESTQTEAA